MNDEVTILGLYRTGVDTSALEGVEVWSLNDWYQFYPGLLPSRVFNIHHAPHIHDSKSRFTGDWKARYTEVIRAGGCIMVAETIEGVLEEGQHEVPLALMTKEGWPLENMPCSISLMIQYAGFLGYKKIKLLGVRLSNSEYEHQLLGICTSIEECRKRGIEVDNPYAADWEARKALIPNWKRGQDVTVGSCPDIIRLHKRQFEIMAKGGKAPE